MRFVWVLLFASCASHLHWTHPNGVAHYKLDAYECERDARIIKQPSFWSWRDEAAVSVDAEFWDQCMGARGWTSAEVSGEHVAGDYGRTVGDATDAGAR